MFSEAYKTAAQFTLPIVLSRKTLGGICSSGIGTHVVINDEGWIITAYHMVKMFQEASQEADHVKDIKRQVQAIESDISLDKHAKRKAIKKLPVLHNGLTEQCSAWWGILTKGVTISEFRGIPTIDLAIGKLEDFDPKIIKQYPVFKDPSKNFDTGTSLCKLGFPFHSINPVWDDSIMGFKLPPGSLPLPLFPIDGIYTRNAEVKINNNPPPFPLLYLETSTPGLRGQSGGPIFDRKGTIWAIQSKTVHLPLGFDPEVPNSGGRKEHQFLNVGWGIHSQTIISFLQLNKIKFNLSDY